MPGNADDSGFPAEPKTENIPKTINPPDIRSWLFSFFEVCCTVVVVSLNGLFVAGFKGKPQ
jgi:hypothetical protein